MQISLNRTGRPDRTLPGNAADRDCRPASAPAAPLGNSAAPLILIAQDEIAAAFSLSATLEDEGFRTLVADGRGPLSAVATIRRPDLVLLDATVPEGAGTDVCRRLRGDVRTGGLGIIMLAATAKEADRVRGLEAGADDYLARPVSTRELLARIRAVLRRTRSDRGGELLCFEDITLDPEARRVHRGRREILLGPKEFLLLGHFMRHPGRIFHRVQLLATIWGDEAAVDPRTIDVNIRRLRQALNDAGGPDPIRTVRSIGYGLDTGPPTPTDPPLTPAVA